MSTYYNLYLGKKNKDGKYSIVGPYMKAEDGKFVLTELCWFRHSCCSLTYMFNNWQLNPDQIADDSKKMLTTSFGDKEYSTGYVFDIEDIRFEGEKNDWGIKNCYVKRKTLSTLEKAGFCIDTFDEIDTRCVSEVAEMTDSERKSWVRTAFRELNSVGDIASRIIRSIPGGVMENMDGYCLICQIG